MRGLIAGAMAASLAGCASVVSGTHQDIVIVTNPPGAACVISRDGMEIGRIALTPATITVEKSRSDLTVSCTKPAFLPAQKVNVSGTDPWTYGNIAIGVAFFGGFIGRGIDQATGAGNQYDDEVTIDLVPVPAEGAPPAPAANPEATPAANPEAAPARGGAGPLTDRGGVAEGRMCGRFSQTRSWPELVAVYAITVAAPPLIEPAGTNIAPTDRIAIVRRPVDGAGRELALARWGLIPSWAKDAKIAARTFNARAETVDEKPSFRAAFRRRRCLIAADGFYEWQATPGGKQPYRIAVADGAVFAFAGLWERWIGADGVPVDSATIIVTAANAAVAPVHDRMPVIFDPPSFEAWLDPATDVVRAKAMLLPYPGRLTLSPVSTRLNVARRRPFQPE